MTGGRKPSILLIFSLLLNLGYANYSQCTGRVDARCLKRKIELAGFIRIILSNLVLGRINQDAVDIRLNFKKLKRDAKRSLRCPIGRVRDKTRFVENGHECSGRKRTAV